MNYFIFSLTTVLFWSSSSIYGSEDDFAITLMPETLEKKVIIAPPTTNVNVPEKKQTPIAPPRPIKATPSITAHKKLEQIQKNIEYIFKNIENTDTDVFVDIQSQRAAEEAIRELIKASGDDEAARTAAATVTPITSNVFKDIKKIDDALMQYLGKKKSLKRKFLNVFKKDEEKQILVSTKTKNAAGRKIITIRSNLNKHIDNLQENKLQTTTLASRVVNMFIDKMISLIRTILSDEDVAQAHDQNN